MAARDEFYVGYQRRAAPGLGRFLLALAASLVVAGALLAGWLAFLQGPFDPGVFEFGVERTFAGVVVERPHPLVRIDRPGGGVSRYYLVGAGKHGAAAAVSGLDGRRVELTGSLIYRQGQTMIELAAGGVAPVETASGSGGPAPGNTSSTELGRRTLRGEIVDSKCYLGVMKPGRGKPHRACATRCISGGIPPILRVETRDGEYRHFLLTGENGEVVNQRILDLVAEPVEVTGQVVSQGDLLLLRADPVRIRRLADGDS